MVFVVNKILGRLIYVEALQCSVCFVGMLTTQALAIFRKWIDLTTCRGAMAHFLIAAGPPKHLRGSLKNDGSTVLQPLDDSPHIHAQ